MTMLWFLIAVLLILWLDGPPLVKKGLHKELYTVLGLIGFAGFLGVLKLFKLPNPISWLDTLLRPLGEVLFC